MKRAVVCEGGKIKFDDATRGSSSHHSVTEEHFSESEHRRISDRTIEDGGVFAKRLSNIMGLLFPILNRGLGRRVKRQIDMEMRLVKQWTKLGLPPSRPTTAIGSLAGANDPGGAHYWNARDDIDEPRD